MSLFDDAKQFTLQRLNIVKSMRTAFITMLFLALINGAFSQSSWKNDLTNPLKTKRDIVNSFNLGHPGIEARYFAAMKEAYNKGLDFFRSPQSAQFQEYIQFQRYSDRVLNNLNDENPIGLYYESQNIWQEYEFERLKNTPVLSLKSGSPEWKAVGPAGNVTMSTTPRDGGGRIDRLRFDPRNVNMMYACSPGGGLWKTTDGGINWTPLTDFLNISAVSDVLIDHSHPDHLYLATGESDTWWMNGSFGVLESFDGGVNWDKTGLVFNLSAKVRIQRLLMHPADPNTLYAATSIGLYRSMDAGVTWTKLNSLEIWNAEFKPGNAEIMFLASTNGFYKSTNSGTNFNRISAGIPTQSISNMNIGISAADPERVYAMIIGTSAVNTLQGIYRSKDSGTSFEMVFNTKNLLSWTDTDLKEGAGGCELAVSDVNADYLLVGGIHNWRSADGGVSWERVGTHDDNVPQNKWTHCDVHSQHFQPGIATTYYSCNDGGIYKTSDDGANWTTIIGNMGTFLTNWVGSSGLSQNKFITGTQDNSCVLCLDGVYKKVGSGDGQHCFFDRTNDNYVYLTAQNGWMQMSSNGGTTWKYIGSNEGTAAWAAPFLQDPADPSLVYHARQKIYRSKSQTVSWASVSTLNAANPIISLTICEVANNILYAVESVTSKIYRIDVNDGTYSTGNNPSGNTIKQIMVNPVNPEQVYIVCQGFANEKKVYVSNNSGKVWVNISKGLPNLPVNCIAYEKGSPERIFIGMNAGIYYRDLLNKFWVPYSDGLPHTQVTDLEFIRPSKTLRASVYGRGIWEIPVGNTLSVQDQNEIAGVRVYPNPTSDILNIESGIHASFAVQICDLAGRQIINTRITGEIGQIVLTELPPGIYILRLTSESKVLSSKFIKE